jgi:hypothetical protein
LDGGGKARSRNHVAFIGAATLTIFIELDAFAFAQMTVTPGPGGIPIAPGSPVAGYTPGGIGLGGVEVAPGPAARDIPMDRIGPGGVPFPPGRTLIPSETIRRRDFSQAAATPALAVCPRPSC